MKSYTDLEQSKILAEILPIESADCYWDYDEMQKFHRINWFEEGFNKESQLRLNENNVCAWSLAALVGVLPVMIDYKGSLIRLRMDKGNVGQDDYAIWYDDLDNGLSTNIASEAKNFIDAAYEMILKLHELNLL